MNDSPSSYGLKELGIDPNDMFWADGPQCELINDSRMEKWKKEKLEYGFDDREMWSLKSRLAIFIYPRLKYFRDNCADMSIPHTLTKEKWEKLLDMMLFSLAEILLDYTNVPNRQQYPDEKELERKCKIYYRKCKDGMRAFGIWFPNLWT